MRGAKRLPGLPGFAAIIMAQNAPLYTFMLFYLGKIVYNEIRRRSLAPPIRIGEMALTVLGIMGGTFDPIHTGHIQIAQIVMKEMQLDGMMFLPDGDPPHKEMCIRDRPGPVKRVRDRTRRVIGHVETDDAHAGRGGIIVQRYLS